MPIRRPDTRIELSELLCFDLYAASRALTAVYRPRLAELGLTYPQYLVLVVLWQEQTRTVKQLSDTLQLDYGTLSPLLRRMQGNGLITRQRGLDDERSVHIHLTTAGESLRLRARSVQAAIRVAASLDDGQVAALQTTLRSIAVSAGRQSMPSDQPPRRPEDTTCEAAFNDPAGLDDGELVPRRVLDDVDPQPQTGSPTPSPW